VSKSSNCCKFILNTQSSVPYSCANNRYSTCWDVQELCQTWNFGDMISCSVYFVNSRLRNDPAQLIANKCSVCCINSAEL